MAGHKPRGVFRAFCLVLIIAVAAALLAAAAAVPAASQAPPAQHGALQAGSGRLPVSDQDGATAEAPGSAEAPRAPAAGSPDRPEIALRSPTLRSPSLSDVAQTAERPSEAEPAVPRPPRVCTGAIPFGGAAAAGEALPYGGGAAALPADGLAGLEEALHAYVSALSGTYGVAVVDLSTGATVSVGGDQVFVAASTFKVPLAMYVFSLVERGEADLAEPLYYAPEDWEGGSGILHGSIAGDCYTVAELVHLSLTVSDNIATNMLLRRFGEQNVFAYMRELGGTVTNLSTGRRATTPRDMALYMEVAYRRAAGDDGGLYRTLLGLLTQTAFSDRIAAGAPSGVSVAHKIGTLPAMVHDVGIVFLQDRPFAIALFSSGVNESVAAASLADITRLVSGFLLTGTVPAWSVPGGAGPDQGGTPPQDAAREPAEATPDGAASDQGGMPPQDAPREPAEATPDGAASDQGDMPPQDAPREPAEATADGAASDQGGMPPQDAPREPAEATADGAASDQGGTPPQDAPREPAEATPGG
ncbi:serine hydrolase [Symbiobacterium thermophilum]|uniref:Putative beta-lactamase n=1 Tax=Symbiobacterium thermophilum (strain DSM 24528 / JCM 14929 / IAM 14863 / T) TaxID=292459 RepID=Q67QS8_SYMTH|nr:serine hydrolase [Symbiobacterium thermophilum]BAD39965.1 putative beta-lactamase [Symbiobacterium thermophilum IAM 14863]